MILAYVPGVATTDYKAAGERLAESYHTAVARSSDQPIFILGDFNQLDLPKYIPGLQQYVTVHTRHSTILDKCFGNIKDAFISISRPALGLSDHNVIHLLPKYRQKVKTEQSKKIERQIWDKDSIEALQTCFEVTDWDMFIQDCPDPNELVDKVSDYIKFCEQTIIKSKTVTIYANNKPWLTKELKQCLVEKKWAHINGNELEKRQKCKDFERMKVIEKKKYKDKVQERYEKGNVKEAWDGLNKMMGKSSNQSNRRLPDTPDPVNDLNRFYARFDIRDFSAECDQICQSIKPEHLELKESEVLKIFQKQKPNKAPGPDGIRGKVIKMCASQLSQIFTQIFQLLFNLHIMPRSWKTSTIIPLPKNAKASQPNDFRPVALTSILAKCFESVLCRQLKIQVATKLDPLQFAYKAKRGVDDACLTLVNLISKHLQNTKASVRILMIDFSSAFNSIEPVVLLKRLLDLNVNGNLILFINDFLKERPQRVLANGKLSDEIIISTGAPQGCVLSPTLFSIYTDEIRFNDSVTTLFKFADDMALVGLLLEEDSLASYFQDVRTLHKWCSDSFLELNVKKTKELVFDEKKNMQPFVPISIANENVEVVDSFKYLGTVLDTKLSFKENTDVIFNKCQQRLYLLRKLKSFYVCTEILETVYRSMVESILTFNIVCWFGFLNMVQKNKLNRIVNLASKIIGKQQTAVHVLYQKALKRKGKSIVECEGHPLASEFTLLPSQRRYRTPVSKKLFRKSFVPSAISVLNSNGWR